MQRTPPAISVGKSSGFNQKKSMVVDVLGTAGNEIVQWVGMLVLIAVIGLLITRVNKLGVKF